MEELQDVLEYCSENIQIEIKKLIKKNIDLINDIQEIRIRTNNPLAIKINSKTQILEYVVLQEDVLKTFEKICENSIYSYKKQICEGFITIKGGHRVGLTGNVVMEEDKIININYISSLNFRIARQKFDCSIEVLKHIINIYNKTIYNTLIVSKPGAGKTTMLRDIIRNLSNGLTGIDFTGKNIGVVDERGEIAAMHKGVAQNDVGIRTDIIDNVSKEKGMKILVRSMAPDIIACDEIGSLCDISAINYAVCSGVKGIFTAHGEIFEEIKLNPVLYKLINTCVLEKIIFLDPENKGKIKSVYELDIKNKKYKLIN